MSTLYPFGPAPGTTVPPTTYDIVFDKTYPRVAFYPTETAGIYQEIVEVGGDLWIVTNATWDVNKLGFYQETSALVNCNAAQPAYAWCQRGLAGDAIRFYAAATNNPNTAVTWVAIFDAAPGSTVVSPRAVTTINAPAFAVNATFDGTISSALTAFAINVQNVASSASSALEVFSVDGNPVWLVDETGTLQIGSIDPTVLDPPVYLELKAGTGIATIGPPPSATIKLSHDDYVDLPNDQTITGKKTIGPDPDGVHGTPMFFGAGTAEVIGSPGVDDRLYITSGCELLTFGPMGVLAAKAQSQRACIMGFKEQQAVNSNPPPDTFNTMFSFYIDNALTPGDTYAPTLIAYFDNSGNVWLAGGLTIGGGLTVTGGVTFTGALTVDGLLTLSGHLSLGATAVTDLETYFETPAVAGSNAPVGALNPTTGYGLHITYDSTNNAIEFDASQLAVVGVANHNGITSADSSVTIVKSGQDVDLSVASAPNGVKIYNEGSSTPLTHPLIIEGDTAVSLAADGNGPLGGSHASVTVNFPGSISFPGAYGLGISTSGAWLAVDVTSKSSSSFTMSVGQIQTNTAIGVSVHWVAVGN